MRQKRKEERLLQQQLLQQQQQLVNDTHPIPRNNALSHRDQQQVRNHHRYIHTHTRVSMHSSCLKLRSNLKFIVSLL